MLEAAGRCIQLRQHLPAMVLIYSHIDTLAWVGPSKQKASVRVTFEDWVNRWFLPELRHLRPLSQQQTCTQLDAASCIRLQVRLSFHSRGRQSASHTRGERLKPKFSTKCLAQPRLPEHPSRSTTKPYCRRSIEHWKNSRWLRSPMLSWGPASKRRLGSTRRVSARKVGMKALSQVTRIS